MPSELFQNKYTTSSTRLTDKDYSDDGKYLITICSKNRQPCFGKIINNKMKLNKIGKIVKQELLKTQKIRKGIKILEHIIMPNHIHFIL